MTEDAKLGSAVPTEPPDTLTPAFAADEQKQQKLRAFIVLVAIDPGPFVQVLDELAGLLIPHAKWAMELDQ